MAMPKAPGQNFLKIIGIFYIIAGALIIISALTLRYVELDTLERNEYGEITVVKAITPMNSLIYTSTLEIMPVWNFTAANSVLAVFERFHFIAPNVQLRSIAAHISEFPLPRARAVSYAIILRWSVEFTIWSIILTFISVIIGIFIVFIGIIAVKYCATLKRTELLIIFALINLGIMLISTVLFISFSAIIGCAVAALYFTASFKNHRQVCHV